VRAAVVAGIDTVLAGEDGDLLALGLEKVAPLLQQLFQWGDVNQRRGAFLRQGHGGSPLPTFESVFFRNTLGPSLAFLKKKL
jgi:hypothetical protein